MAETSVTIAKRLLLVAMPFLLVEALLRVLGIGGSIIYEEHPAFGYRPRPNQEFSTMGHRIRILENGFRAPRGTNGWLIVGDSVTYGTAYIRDEETFCALLGADNAGVNGWGPLNIARFLETVTCQTYRAIIWVFPSCDVLRPFMTLRAGLISTNRRMWFRTEYLLRFLWYGHIRPSPQPQDPVAFEPNWTAVRDTHDRLTKEGCRLLMVFVPAYEECNGGETFDTPFFRELIERARDEGIDFVYANPPHPCRHLYRDTAHLTPAGNQWLAAVISEALKERQW